MSAHSQPETNVIGILSQLAELPNLTHTRITGSTQSWHDWDRINWNIKTHNGVVWKEARFDDTFVSIFPPLNTLQAVSD